MSTKTLAQGVVTNKANKCRTIPRSTLRIHQAHPAARVRSCVVLGAKHGGRAGAGQSDNQCAR